MKCFLKTPFKIKAMNEIKITGKGLVMEVDRFFGSSQAKKELKTPGTIITGRVIEGKAVPGETILIEFHNGKTIVDKIKCIEKNKARIPYAVPLEEIGVCLEKTDTKKIKEIIASPSTKNIIDEE